MNTKIGNGTGARYVVKSKCCETIQWPNDPMEQIIALSDTRCDFNFDGHYSVEMSNGNTWSLMNDFDRLNIIQDIATGATIKRWLK